MTIKVGTLADDAVLKGSPARRRDMVERVRAAGLDHVFVPDHVSFHVGFGVDGLIQAATLAGLDPTLRVFVGVYLLALRHPVLVARQIATLAESAPGQLVLGVGVGGEDRHEIEICGVDPATRGRRTDACLAAVRDLLRGEPVSCENEFFSFEKAWIRPAPEQRVPIVVGGRADAALRRAGKLGDGWVGIWSSPRRYAEAVAEVEGHGADRQIDWRHGLQVWVGLDAGRNRARERLSSAMKAVYQVPFEKFEKYSPYGAPAQVAEFLAPYAEAGCRDFNIMAVASSSEMAVDGVGEIRERLRALVGV